MESVLSGSESSSLSSDTLRALSRIPGGEQENDLCLIPLSAGSLPIAVYVLDPPVRWKVLGGSPWGTPASEDCKALDLPRGQTHLMHP